ncbi:ABC transporter permease subunit [Basilea psittacipulmonis]|uniref:Spermidine/putrescine ABC transporter permease n=1 Tax=Basilea psittacipulmonis DSM 24701 TaxID=1072685 RepID=A0A077DF91_9BURK|nr:ABC transporter permease subunit [Basilea psittacipulmonis]AIL32786.1 spermidine/putrescine ABC transporter permease [Basilea psittacipulmonis DSM 24701]
MRNFKFNRDILAILPPYLWLIICLFIPFIIVLKISFAESLFGIPPYGPLVQIHDHVLNISLHFEGFSMMLDDSMYLMAYLNSLKMALITTIICILIGYPMAYYIARSRPSIRNILMLAVILPFWTSLLLRVYAWVGILRNEGLLNKLLMSLGLIAQPLEIYRTDIAVYIGLIYTYLPFFILPLYTNLVKLDQRLLDAAYDLGAKPWRAFVSITLPLSMPGVIAGAMLVFIPVVGEYVIPELLGGSNTYMIGRVMMNQFFSDSNWPVAAAVAVVMILVLLIPLAIFQYNSLKTNRGTR